MKVTVGGRERIELVSLSIPKGEDAWIEFMAGDWLMRFHIVTEKTDVKGGVDSATIKCVDAGEHAQLILGNWTGGERMVFLDPLEIGSNRGRKVVALVQGEVLNTTTLLQLDFFWEKANV